MEENSVVELVLKGKAFHDQSVMSATGAGRWEWQHVSPTFAPLSVAICSGN